MRRFDADYLRRTREGMWDDSQDALTALSLDSRTRILDVGCGTGALSRILVQSDADEVVGCDADRGLLHQTPATVSVVQGDARSLPFSDNTFDLVVCQALLINILEPTTVVEEFVRVSADLVAAVEPDNSAVDIRSTVNTEPSLEHRARRAYLEGIDTDVTLGEDVTDVFESVGLELLDTHRYDHNRTIDPPYDEHSVVDARRKATGAGLATDKTTMLEGNLTEEDYDELRADWREMGRTVVDQMQTETYRREEIVPFFVTVGRVR